MTSEPPPVRPSAPKRAAGARAAASGAAPAEPTEPAASARWAFLRRVNRTAVIVVLAVLLVVTASIAGYLFSQYQQLANNPQAANDAQTSALIEKVGKLMVLPAGQTPTVATVSDTSKLASQPFFKEAKNGDELLIYSEAKQAIIYRPSENKIINVGPIALNASGNVDSTPSEAPSVAPIVPTSTPTTTGKK